MTIDISQWLPRDRPIVTFFRLQHGDIRPYQDEDTGKIKGAISGEDKIIHWLLDNGHIEMHHKVYAMSFMDLRRAYEAGIGLKWCMGNGREMAGLSAGDASECYDKIAYRMGRKETRILIDAIEKESKISPVESCNNTILESMAGVYVKQFNRLVTIMDEEMEKRKETLEEVNKKV